MSTYSIKRRLILAVISGSAIVLLTGSVFIDVMTGNEMQIMFDSALLDKARALEAMTEQDIEGVDIEIADDVMSEFGGDNDSENITDLQYFQLWINEDFVFKRSGSLGEGNLHRYQTVLNQYSFHDAALPDGRPGRYVETVFYPRLDAPDEEDIILGRINARDIDDWLNNVERQPITLVVARERSSLQELQFTNRVIITSTMLMVLLAIAVLVKKLVSRGLYPLDQLADQVRDIDETSLDNQITRIGELSIELAPIEQQLNRLLQRLDTAFLREKRFSADVAHELRTPLAELKTLAEVGIIKLDEPEITKRFFCDVKEISAQMEKLVTSLLELAKADADLLQLDNEDFSLTELLDSCSSFGTSNLSKDQCFQNLVPAALLVHTDREKLELILRNLLDNAVNYSPPNACIRIYGSHKGNGYDLTIENPVLDLKPEDIHHICERFWRKDQARCNSLHAGLGLALVQALAEVLNLKLNFELNEQKIFCVKLHGLQVVD